MSILSPDDPAAAQLSVGGVPVGDLIALVEANQIAAAESTGRYLLMVSYMPSPCFCSPQGHSWTPVQAPAEGRPGDAPPLDNRVDVSQTIGAVEFEKHSPSPHPDSHARRGRLELSIAPLCAGADEALLQLDSGHRGLLLTLAKKDGRWALEESVEAWASVPPTR
ncbi:MAG: hypothetical protein JST54_23120 [Deltaproteobacteria bacterium]|nr:hypothetical protein [Deltaproteobacteria bacterium]